MMAKKHDPIESMKKSFYFSWLLNLFVFAIVFYHMQWATKEGISILAVALTFFEIFLIIALATGFWMIRREAIDKAEEAAREEARECVEEVAQKLLERKLQPLVFRGISKILGETLIEKGLKETDVSDIMQSLDKDGEGDAK